MAKVISKLSPSTAFVDSCDVNSKRFGKEISKLTSNTKIRSYHHADSKFITVSAASILAKVSRDRAITRLSKKHDIGSGYPSDPKTKVFVKKSIRRNQNLTFLRKSWKPVKILMKKNYHNNVATTIAWSLSYGCKSIVCLISKSASSFFISFLITLFGSFVTSMLLVFITKNK